MADIYVYAYGTGLTEHLAGIHLVPAYVVSVYSSMAGGRDSTPVAVVGSAGIALALSQHLAKHFGGVNVVLPSVEKAREEELRKSSPE